MAALLRLPGGKRNRGNKNREGKYYARVNIPRPGQRPKQKVIPLRTENPREAALRLLEVEKVEPLIKQGLEFEFPWMRGQATTVKQLSVKQASKDYLRIRKNEGLRPKSLEIFHHAVTHFIKIVGASKPLESISAEDIQEFIRKSREKLGPVSINMYLRNLRTFFRWANDLGMMSHPPKIKEIPEPDDLPSYISYNEFHQIQDHTTPFLADVFWFYRETGARMSEPFDAVLKGSFLIILTENAKGRQERQIQLTPDLIQIYEQMIAAGHRPDYYSKKFKHACRAAGIDGHNFHHLRHTFGVRCWLQCGDIFLVKQLMGHKSIETTLRYTKFFLSRLQEDFPDLAGYADNQSRGRAEIIGRGTGSTEGTTSLPYTGERIRQYRPRRK